jgi:hypothetical protein
MKHHLYAKKRTVIADSETRKRASRNGSPNRPKIYKSNELLDNDNSSHLRVAHINRVACSLPPGGRLIKVKYASFRRLPLGSSASPSRASKGVILAIQTPCDQNYLLASAIQVGRQSDRLRCLEGYEPVVQCLAD